MGVRFYTSDCQASILNLLAEEIEKWPDTEPIPHELYVELSNPEKHAGNSINELCLFYREIILCKAYMEKSRKS